MDCDPLVIMEINKETTIPVMRLRNSIKQQQGYKDNIKKLSVYSGKLPNAPYFFLVNSGVLEEKNQQKKIIYRYLVMDNQIPIRGEVTIGDDTIIVVSYFLAQTQPDSPTKLPEMVFLFEGEPQPFLFPAGWWPCDRLYVLSIDSDFVSNKIFCSDMKDACKSISTHSGKEVQLYPIEAEEFKISSKDNFELNAFIQDQFIIGFIGSGPNTIKKVAFNYRTYTDRPIKDFITKLKINQKNPVDTSERIVKLIDAFKDDMQSSFNFGGNIMISPPVTEDTQQIPKNAAGPTIPAHPQAPFGKIIVGDSETGSIAKILRIFLTSQKVQPVIPIDTSWLLVGHVDEFLSFVPSQKDSSTPFKALYADPELMIFMIQETRRVSGTGIRQTNFFRGKYYHDKNEVGLFEESLNDLLVPSLNLISYNNKLQTQKLNPIKERLQQGLKMLKNDFISMPVAFFATLEVSSSYKTSAKTVNIVNLQYINGHILLPRPFGPRLSMDSAKNVVSACLKKAGINITDIIVNYPEDKGFWTWQEKFTAVTDIALSYLLCANNNVEERPLSENETKNIISHLKVNFHKKSENDRFEPRKKYIENTDPSIKSGIENLEKKIVAKNADKFQEHPVFGGLVVRAPCKIWIPEETVDVIELYVYTIFKSLLGIPETNVHFIDDWIYHLAHGEVHCASVAERTIDSSIIDWNKYEEVMKSMQKYDFTYDPKQ